MATPLQDQIREVEDRLGIRCGTMAFDSIGPFGMLAWECHAGHKMTASVATARRWTGCPQCLVLARRAQTHRPRHAPARAAVPRGPRPSVFSLAAEVVAPEELAVEPASHQKKLPSRPPRKPLSGVIR